jgi:hypothetical protein
MPDRNFGLTWFAHVPYSFVEFLKLDRCAVLTLLISLLRTASPVGERPAE